MIHITLLNSQMIELFVYNEKEMKWAQVWCLSNVKEPKIFDT